jgi:hypothetical protein
MPPFIEFLECAYPRCITQRGQLPTAFCELSSGASYRAPTSWSLAPEDDLFATARRELVPVMRNWLSAWRRSVPSP